MKFNKHLELEGQHALLAPSTPYWLNYTEEDLKRFQSTRLAALKGTEDHAFAALAIARGQKLGGNSTIDIYVNDCIGFGMSPEVHLKYSDYCFGTADAICFKRKKLRINDLKTGVGKGNMNQLLIYAGLFCLEYKKNPHEFETELRIYQYGESTLYIPTKDELAEVCDKIILQDRRLKKFEEDSFDVFRGRSDDR